MYIPEKFYPLIDHSFCLRQIY